MKKRKIPATETKLTQRSNANPLTFKQLLRLYIEINNLYEWLVGPGGLEPPTKRL